MLGGPLNTIEDLFNNEQFVARNYFQEIDHPETGPIKYPGFHNKLYREGAEMPARRRGGAHGRGAGGVRAWADDGWRMWLA